MVCQNCAGQAEGVAERVRGPKVETFHVCRECFRELFVGWPVSRWVFYPYNSNKKRGE